jgi:Ca2+-binding EF-hand superfamily protein
MKTIPVSLIVATLLVPVVVSAQTRGGSSGPLHGGGDGKRDGPRPFLEAWKAADTDSDGSLSETEFSGLPRMQRIPEEKRGILFKRLDKNTDGKLDREELGQMSRGHDGQGPPMQRLWELDADRSGGVSFEEFKAGRLHTKLDPEKQQALFRRLDSNGDGFITPADRPEPPFRRDGDGPQQKRGSGGQTDGPRPESRQMIRQLDQNQDGALSFEEFRVGPVVKGLTEDEQEERFEALDKDHDLKISGKDFPPPTPHEGSKRKETPPAMVD